MGDEQHRPVKRFQRVLEALACGQIEVIGRFVEDKKISVFAFEYGQSQLCAFAARQHFHLFVHVARVQLHLREDISHLRLLP